MPQAVGAARRALRAWESDLEPTLLYDLSLCVSELVTHSVQLHSSGEIEEAELAVRRTRTMARVEVIERRQGGSVGSLLEGSDGLRARIVVNIADRWGVDGPAGKRVWCEIDLAADGRSRRRALVAGAATSATQT
jgi:hypothetical protein